MLRLFDSHAHYDDERFEEEFEGGTRGALETVYNEGICGVLNVGANLDSSANSVRLAEQFSHVWAAVGVHPSDAQRLGMDRLNEAVDTIRTLAAQKKVVAVGEIGLDYHYDEIDKDCQAAYFAAQMELARELKLPVIIHTRDAMGDTLDLLARYPDVTGVMHSYSGSAEVARQLSDKGWYISFSGPVTYKNAAKVKEAAAIVPEDRILVETDSPYLPPVPYRGKMNYSGYMHYTLEAVAAIREKTPEDMAAITVANTCRLFGITL
ncbi:MAG: TatD family hydrolase [Clostridia bacterium]|nr:TatD family hydrolase [Clostridia bacterium]